MTYTVSTLITVKAASAVEEAAAYAAYPADTVLVLRTDLLPAPPPPPPSYEDLTTYTEVDPSSMLTVTSSQVAFASLTRNVTAYVAKDFGVGHFSGNFSVDFEYTPTASTSGFNGGICAFANVLSDSETIRLASGDLQAIFMGNSSGTQFMCLHEICAGAEYNSSFFNPTLNTTYYGTYSRNTSVGTYGTNTLKIYSDSARTTLLSTLTLTLHSSVSFRYLHAVQSLNSGHSYTESGTIANIGVS